jgi:hypothetical protein
MTQITLDSNAISKLDALTQTAEVCDPSGRIVGNFVPNALDDFDPRELCPFIGFASQLRLATHFGEAQRNSLNCVLMKRMRHRGSPGCRIFISFSVVEWTP